VLAWREPVAAADLAAVLDPRHVPTRGWGDEIAAAKPRANGDDPVIVSKEDAARELRNARTDQQLGRALIVAFDAFDTAALVELLRDRKADVERLNGALFDARRPRRRLVALKASLLSGASAMVVEEEDDEAESVEPDDARDDARRPAAWAAIRAKLGDGRRVGSRHRNRQ